ncbi:MAG TPA: YceD family protein [Candidatus Cybelea sp.]|jgi:uncharacterized metal-binding protein YceD (DUF177 family)|nr:YceD family protein [Candidatus Cybelea sp.]
MPLQINIRHVEEKEIRLHGLLDVAELDLEDKDELVRARLPLHYDLTAQMAGEAILVQGRLELTLDCECARCLKPFQHRMLLEHWTAHLPLEGPEKAPRKDDLADLTPYLREDILLELPQHPLCEADCAGLPNRARQNKTKSASQTEGSSAWSELNKLKF